jgi:hypothetical protein
MYDLSKILKQVVILIYLVSASIFAQETIATWAKTYGGYPWGGEWAVSMTKTSDECYLITGRFDQGTNNGEIWTLKVDSRGDTIWTRKYGKEWNDEGLFVKETSDGNYLVYGSLVYTYLPYLYDRRNILLKYDPNGNLIWFDLASGPGQFCFTSLESGIVIADVAGSGLALTNKSDTDSILWQKIYSIPLNFRHFKIVSSADNGYACVGSQIVGIQSPVNTICLIKTNAVGDTLWTRTYNQGYGKGLGLTIDGGFIICGAKEQDQNTDGIALKVDSIGDTTWTRTIPMSWGSLNDVKQTSDSGFIFIGDSYRGIELVKTDFSGVVEWSRFIVGDRAYCIEIANDGGYVFLGRTSSLGSGGLDIFLVKTDQYGRVKIPTTLPNYRNSKVDAELLKIYPNPMNNHAIIQYSLISREHVRIMLYSIVGQKIKTIYEGVKNSGDHTLQFTSEGLSSGIYVIELRSINLIYREKVLILK